MALIAVMLVVVALASVLLVGSTSGHVRAARLAAATAGHDAHAVLVGRFIDRSMRYRRNGALAGLVVLVAVVIVRAAAGDADTGVRFDLLTLASIGLAGSIIGSITAEGFRLRSHRGPRVATLDVRSMHDYRDPISDRREQVVAALALVGALGSFVVGAAQLRAVAFALVIALLAGIRRWAIHRIALRPRPALPDDLRRADDELRRLAASVGLSRPMVTLGALLVAAQWGAVSAGAAAGRTGTTTDVIQVTAWIGSVGAFLVAVRWWWLNRSFGLQATDPLAARPRRGVAVAAAVAAAVVVVATFLVLLARSS